MTDPKAPPSSDPAPRRPEDIVELVRDRYGRIARRELPGCSPAPGETTCCGDSTTAARIG
jgi:hypothetical protein